MKGIELFAGPGGFSLGAHALGIEPLGIESVEVVCDTRRAAGLPTMQADVAALDPVLFGSQNGDAEPVDLLIGSPPCPTFSAAGGRGGVALIDVIIATASDLAAGEDTREQRTGEAEATLYPAAWEYERAQAKRHGREPDPAKAKARADRAAALSLLVVEPLRWALALRPRYIALEQVPPVLDLWRQFAGILEGEGYGTWTGILEAERYGVPQTRERAFLIAQLGSIPHPPVVTHQRYVPGEGAQAELTFEGELLPWVSMAEALGWPQGEVGFPRLADGQGGETDDGYRERDFRSTDEPAFNLTEKSRSWSVRLRNNAMKNAAVRDIDEPAPTITAAHDHGERRWEATEVTYENGTHEKRASRHLDEPAPTVHFGERLNTVTWHLNTGRDWKPGGTRETAQRRDADQPSPAVGGVGDQWQWRPSHVVDTGNTRSGSREEGRLRESDEPAPVITSRADQLEVRDGEPDWARTRPATTVQGDHRIWPPGHKVNADDERRGHTHYGDRAGTEAIRVEPWEAAVLQGFPPNYPWQGTRTAQFAQIGNAVPPLLAMRVLEALVPAAERPELEPVEGATA